MATGYTPEEIAELKAREADEIKRLGAASIETRMALMDMAAGTKGLTASLTKGFGQLGSSALGLTKQLADGEIGASVFNNSISGVTDALGDLVGLIPYVGGALKTLVKGAGEYTQAVNKQADLLHKNYQEMSKIGAAGADGMQGVYDNLKRMNYGTEELDKFVGIVRENSQTLAHFGGTVSQGLTQMAGVAQSIQQSDVGRQFRDMGMSVDDINKGIAGFTKMQSLYGTRQKMSTDEQAAAAANYIKEVDMLAKITGKNREQQMALEESAMAEERFAGYRSELKQRADLGDKAAEEQLKQVDRTQKMLADVAPETRKGFLNILSGTLDTPEAQKLLLTMPEAAAVAGKKTFDAAELQNAMLSDLKKNADNAKEMAKMGVNDTTYIKYTEQLKLRAQLEAGTIDEREAQAKKEQEVTDKATQNMTDLQDANRKSRDKLQDLVNAGIVPVTSGMKGLANAADATTEGMTKLAEKLGVPVKKREEPGGAAKAEARPAAGPPGGAAAPAPAPGAPPTAAPAPAVPAGKPAVSKELAGDLMSRLSSSGITDKRAQANILAQVDAESKGRTGAQENLNYSPEQLLKVFPKKFKDLDEAKATVAGGQEAIGNKIYGGRMGNAENEGFLYRGRGLIQLTGKQNYEKFGKLLGIDLVKNPDMAADPEVAKQIAVAYFAEKQKAGVDLSDIKQVGKAVGYAGGDAETAKRAGLANAYLDDTKTAQPAAAKAEPKVAAAPVAPKPAKKEETAAPEAATVTATETTATLTGVTAEQIISHPAYKAFIQKFGDTPATRQAAMSAARSAMAKEQAQPVAPRPQANGGVIPATPGGVNVVAAEAGMNEAFVPLPDGKSIPVQIAGNDEQMSMMAQQLDKLDQLVRIMQSQVGVSEQLLKYAQ